MRAPIALDGDGDFLKAICITEDGKYPRPGLVLMVISVPTVEIRIYLAEPHPFVTAQPLVNE